MKSGKIYEETHIHTHTQTHKQHPQKHTHAHTHTHTPTQTHHTAPRVSSYMPRHTNNTSGIHTDGDSSLNTRAHDAYTPARGNVDEQIPTRVSRSTQAMASR